VIPLTYKDAKNNYTGLGIYNGNLYALDGLNGQILKNDKSGNAFSAPKNWLADNTDIKGGVDLAIDGSIYILKENGDLLKFLKGKKTDFTLDKIEPALQAPTKLYLTADQKFIYIMEPKNERIAIFDKAGKYILQYSSDKFNNLKSFYPDEKNKLIYVLNSTEILSFKATHL
jgi:DNA-binding beta-propeller fold protein YncE